MDKEKRKKIAATAIMCLLVVFESLATLRLALAVAYPDRMLRERIAEYFMQSLGKAVKFEYVSFDHMGNLVINGLDISITSDFNDNISLVKSRKSVIDLAFFPLMAGRVTVREIDINDPVITLIKRYGKTYRESLQQAIDTEKFLSHIRKGGGDFALHVRDATLEYRESLSDRIVIVRFDDVNGTISLCDASLSYRLKGDIRRQRTEFIRRGNFSCTGSVDVSKLDSFRHAVSVNNFDLSYLNEYIIENKWAMVSLEGGASVNMEITGSKNEVFLKGTAETNTLTVTDVEEKYDYISNENLDLDVDMSIDRSAKEFAIRGMRLSDGVFSMDASGLYVRDEKDHRLELQFKTNRTNLADLAERITPYRDYSYAGFLECAGGMKIDFTRGDARGMALNLVLDDFTVARQTKGDPVMVMDRSSARIMLKNDVMNVSLEMRPLGSDCSIKSETKIAGWIPLKSETEISVHSRRMNLDALGVTLAAIGDALFASAYGDRGGPVERPSFPESYFGKFMFNNTIRLRSGFDTVFFGRKARWSNCNAEINLARGTLLLSNFEVEGYGARYALSLQGYFNSEMPYVKIDGRVDDFNVTDFYSDSGMKGIMTGTARADFGYDVSAARTSDILNNSKGRYSVTIAAGEMKNTSFQVRLADFLKKNGYAAGPLENIIFDSVSLSGTHQGEHFWISGLGIRGDELVSNCFGDYQYTRGLRCKCSASIRGETSAVTVPFQLKGQLGTPCIEITGKEKSSDLCF